MDIYSPFGFFVVLALLLLFIRLPVFDSADSTWHEQGMRTTTIDGLRGFLALGVFFHHALIYYMMVSQGKWEMPSAFYNQLGEAAVMLFFMITGFLFWGKAIRAEGRMSWRKLYVGRVFRIGPLYYLATILVLLIVFYETGFELREPPVVLLKQIIPSAFFGLFEYNNVINTYPSPKTIVAGVTWTLHDEWIFYLALPLFAALFVRPRGVHIWFAGLGFAYCVGTLFAATKSPGVPVTAFFAGMVSASLFEHGAIDKLKLHDGVKSAIVLILLAVLVANFRSAYTGWPVLLLWLVFLLVVSGCSMFGLLLARSSRRMGEISYGIYLLQGIVLYVLFSFPQMRTLALGSTLSYWVSVLFAAVLLVGLSYAAHLAIEKPGIAMGKSVIKKLGL